VLNGIFWVLRSGAPWRDLPESYGPYTTCYNRFVRWRQAGREALAAAHDTSVVRVHQHGASVAGNREQHMGRSRGRLASKIHAVVDANGLPVQLGLTPGEAHDNRLRPELLTGLQLAVDGASLADRTVIANGFPDDLGKAIGEIFIVEQFAGAGSPARGRRG